MTAPVVESATLSKLTSNGDTLTVDMPATRPDGDLYVVILGKDSAEAWVTIPGKWNSILEHNGDEATTRIGAWWWRGDSEPASYLVEFSNDQVFSVVYHLSGAHVRDPIDASGGGGASGSNQSAPAVTTGIDDCLLIRGIITSAFREVTATQPIEDFKGELQTSSGGGYGASHDVVAVAGDSGAKQFTHGSGKPSTLSVAIRPLIQGPPGFAGAAPVVVVN